MAKNKKSYIKNSIVYFSNTGGYYEVPGFGGLSTGGIVFDDGGLKQTKLVIPISETSTGSPIKKLWEKLGIT